MARKTKFYPNDPRDLPGDNFAFVRKALTAAVYHVVEGKPLTATLPLAPQPPDGAIWCQWCGEHPALPGEPCDVCRKMGAEAESVPVLTQPNALAAMLGLTPDQTESFKGTDRLNFWRNGCLNVQVQHGCRATKIKLPTAVVTDAQLDDFFASWGWQKLGQKPYYKPNAGSLVRL